MARMSKADRLLTAIAMNADERLACEKKLDDLRTKGDALIVQAHEEGVPKLTLARVAVLARQTVYTILLRAKAAA